MERVKWGDLTPLTEDNQDYEPEIEEIEEYAQFIGLELPRDSQYLYLAREGLKAPLPPFWEACEDPQGQLYFRNRKTRAISLDNPLDQIYIQKVRQLRHRPTDGFFAIAEESALNESSGLARSRPGQDKPERNAPPQHNRILDRHITEESIYSEPSAEKASPRRSDLQEEPLWKQQQRAQLAELRARVDRFVPSRQQLITHAAQEEAADLVGKEDLEELVRLRLHVEKEKARLEQRKRERRELQATLDQIRATTRAHY